MNAICTLVAPHHGKHCPGKENPADIPSRGMSADHLADTPLWLNGPDWLLHGGLMEEPDLTVSAPEECKCEMKKKDAVHLLADTQSSNSPCLRQLIDPE